MTLSDIIYGISVGATLSMLLLAVTKYILATNPIERFASVVLGSFGMLAALAVLSLGIVTFWKPRKTQ